MEKDVLTIEELSEIKGYHPVHIKRLIKKGKIADYSYRVIAGRRRLIFGLSNLTPSELETYLKQGKRSNKEATQPFLLAKKQEPVKKFDEQPEHKKDLAFKRLNIIEQFNKYCSESRRKREYKAAKDFIVRFRIDNPQEEQFGARTLFRWIKAYKKSGLKGLLNGYGKVFRYVDWPDDAKAWLWQKYNTPQSPSASWCIRDLGYKASAEGWPLPSDRTMRRFLESIPLEIKEFYRKGEKHWKQKFLPCILRDDSAKPGEVFISDHAQINIGVRHPSGKVIFPWITCWMDMRTRKILGWCLAEKGKCVPSSETINISLKYTIEKYGIPKHVLIDNGRDFSCYHFTGGQKEKRFRFSLSVNEIEVAGIYKLLGIEAHFCIPANAQAKPIERWFWTNETNFQVEFETYRGNNILNRPEGVDSRIKSGKSVPEWGEFKKFLGNYIEIYNQDHKHSGFGMGGRSPNEIWNKYFADAAHEMRKASPSSLRLLMMPSSRPCKVGRNGITAFDNFYISNDLLKFIGKKVLYRYDPEDFDEIYVYDLENRFLCLAKKRIRTAWNDKEAFKRNKELEKTRKRGIREANEAQKEIIEAKKGYKERKPSGKNPDKPPKVVKMFPTPFEGVQEKIDRKKSRGQTDEQKAIRRAISESSSRMTEEDIKNMEEEEERQAIRDKLKKEFF